jgi:hypothetical protein
VAEAGDQIFVYCTLKFKNNNLPLQKFCLDSKPLNFFTKVDILEMGFQDIVFSTQGFKMDMELVIVTASSGQIYIFRLFNDYELYQ